MPTGPRLATSAAALIVSGWLSAPSDASIGGGLVPIVEQSDLGSAASAASVDVRLDAGIVAQAMGQDDDPAWADDIAAFYAARGATPLWHDDHGATERGDRLSAALADASDWGLDPTALRVAPAVDKTSAALLAADVRLTLAAVRYARAAQNGQVAARDLSGWLEATAKPFTAGAVLATLVMAEDPASALVSFHPQHDGFRRLQRAYAAARASGKRHPAGRLAILRANLERWRWLPENLGARHVWNNVPAYETHVVEHGRTIHRERLIVGTRSTQTPVFSDEIRFIVFRPDWGVPPSLKVKDLLPRLARGDTRVLDRRDMRILGASAASYDWRDVDIRTIPIVQRPGPSNPLGRMKFMFPNRHDVYMHDTPDQGLFSRSGRALSNGCIRVRAPERLAEILLQADQGLDARAIARLVDGRSQENNRVDLLTPVAVHNVYFTAEVDEAGTIVLHDDIYGHDSRVDDALNGMPLDEIQARDPALAHAQQIERLMRAGSAPPASAGNGRSGNRVRTVDSAPRPVAPSGGAGAAGGSGYPSWARSVFQR